MRLKFGIYLCLVLATLIFNTNVHAESKPATSMAEFCKDLPRPEYARFELVPSSQEWFELYNIAEGVTAIYEPHQWQEVISYLIEGDSTALLFDTGNGLADIASVAKGLTDKPISVFNSHSHYDHVGGNFSFKNVYGMNTAFTRERQAGHANKEIAIEASAQALCRALPKGVSEDTHVGKPYQINNFVEAGHIFDLGNRKLEVIHIPGHTPDAVAMIDRDAGLLWTGDSYYSGPIWLFAPETDLNAYRKSLVELIAVSKDVKALLPAHNTPLVKPSILQTVLDEFDAMLAGKIKATPVGDGMVEYSRKSDLPFSFLMRDEPLPYSQNP